MKKCFFAYSDKGHKVSDSISETIKEINAGGYLRIDPWDAMDIQGTSIPKKVIQSIDECDVFLCDNTNLNNNVLFELGYAIGKKKPVRIYINSSFEGVSERIKNFNILSTIGYEEYSNSQQLSKLIWGLSTDDQDLLIDVYSKDEDRSVTGILYLKSIKESEHSLWVTNAINRLKISRHIDDPEEIVSQSLGWYINELIYANGVIGFLQDNLSGSITRNEIISFIVGIGTGMSLPVLLLSAEEYEAPMDYKEVVIRFNNKEQCERIIKEWVNDNKEILEQDSRHLLSNQYIRQRNKLQSLNIGQSIAENEPEELLRYFVETSAYREAKNKSLSLFIGRKGVGKTANLLKLANELDTAKRLVCVIKPIQYEIEGIVELMNQLSSVEKSYLIQSVWKYLIYTELLKNIYEKLEKRPAFYEKNPAEKEIYKFVEENREIVLNEFSERTQKVIGELNDSKINGASQEEYRLRVSEILHNRIISKARKNLSDYCGEKDQIVILIDNLDKSWTVDSNIEQVSRFIYGLLDVGDGIVRDFSKDSNWNKKININLIIFLREDIFSVIKKYAPEADKLQISKMIWNDKELLLRVIEERINPENNENIWSEYFCEEVGGIPIKDYLVNCVLPKPRDLIYLVSMAIENAKNRKHSLVEENDLRDAVSKYSNFALQTLITELQVECSQIEDFLLELMGRQSVIDEEELKKCGRDINLDEEKIEEIISSLCQMLFLGMEIHENDFQYCYDMDNYKKYKILANRIAIISGAKKYKIHPAFYATLMIAP